MGNLKCPKCRRYDVEYYQGFFRCLWKDCGWKRKRYKDPGMTRKEVEDAKRLEQSMGLK